MTDYHNVALPEKRERNIEPGRNMKNYLTWYWYKKFLDRQEIWDSWQDIWKNEIKIALPFKFYDYWLQSCNYILVRLASRISKVQRRNSKCSLFAAQNNICPPVSQLVQISGRKLCRELLSNLAIFISSEVFSKGAMFNDIYQHPEILKDRQVRYTLDQKSRPPSS